MKTAINNFGLSCQSFPNLLNSKAHDEIPRISYRIINESSDLHGIEIVMQHAICNLTAQDKQTNKINNVFSNYVV